MVNRKERKQKADAKRSAIVLLIAEYMQKQIDLAYRTGMHKPVLYALQQLDKFVVRLLKDRPEDAHLIRSAALQFARYLRGTQKEV